MRRSIKQKKKRRVIDNSIYITSATELDQSVLQRISDIFGKENEMKVNIDPNIIGGIRIKQGVKLFDGTVVKHLNELRRKLYNL